MNRAWRNFAIGVVLALIIISLTPYLWMFLASVKTRVDALAATPQWFFAPTLEHYRTVFVQKHYLPLVGNSIMVASGTTLLSLLVGTPAAYVFARHQFAGKEDLFFFFLTTRMAPAVSVVVPMFLLFGKLGLLDSLYAVILAHSSFNLSLVVWMMRSFFEEIPPEVDEAAQMDGNTRAGTFVRILLPMAAPGIAAATVLCFILSWNELLYAMILTAFESRTLTVGIPGLVTPHGTLWGQVAAVAIAATLPIVFFAFLVQKHLVRGLTFTAVKR